MVKKIWSSILRKMLDTPIPKPINIQVLRAGYGDDPAFMFKIHNVYVSKEERRGLAEEIAQEINKIITKKYP